MRILQKGDDSSQILETENTRALVLIAGYVKLSVEETQARLEAGEEISSEAFTYKKIGETLRVHDRVMDDEGHTGIIERIEEGHAYIRWHKGYASWKCLSEVRYVQTP